MYFKNLQELPEEYHDLIEMLLERGIIAENITREILELQLNALRQELLSGSTLQAANLSNRIDLLERQIELLQ